MIRRCGDADGGRIPESDRAAQRRDEGDIRILRERVA